MKGKKNPNIFNHGLKEAVIWFTLKKQVKRAARMLTTDKPRS